jgi:hypothetical protein
MEPTPKPCLVTLKPTMTLPVIGKLRLGTARETSTGTEVKNLNWFRLDTRYKVLRDKFRLRYGEKPWQLRIAFGSNDPRDLMPNQLEEWIGLVRVCEGNSHTAKRMWKAIAPEQQRTLQAPESPFGTVEVPCPCPRKGVTCDLRAHLYVILPDIQPASQVEVITSSIINLEQLMGALESYRSLFGRLMNIPFTLSRRKGYFCIEGKATIQYLLELVFEGDLQATNQIRAESGLEPLPYTALLESLPAFEQAEPDPDESEPPPPTSPVQPTERRPPRPGSPAPRETAEAPGGAPGTPGTGNGTAMTGPVMMRPQPDGTPGHAEAGRGTPQESQGANRPPRPSPAGRPAAGPDRQAARAAEPGGAKRTDRAPEATAALVCRCGAHVTERVAAYSRQHYQAVLCMQCQRKTGPAGEVRKTA